MFETTLMLKLTPWAVSAPHRDVDYQKCWQTLPHGFRAGSHGASGTGVGQVDSAGEYADAAAEHSAASGGGAAKAAGQKRKH